MTYSFAFELTPQERIEIARRMPSHAGRVTLYDAGWFVVCLSGAITGTVRWAAEPTVSWTDVGLSVMGWVLVVGSVGRVVGHSLRDALGRRYGVGTPVTITVDESGITEFMAPATHELWGWDEIRNVQSNPSGVLIEFRDGKACRIPARAFTRNQKPDDVIALVERMRRTHLVADVAHTAPECPVVTIPSGQWRWYVEGMPPHTLTLFDAAEQRNRLTIDLDKHDDISPEGVAALTRNPDQRAWVDELGVEWLIEFPEDDVATAVPVRSPNGSNTPSRVVWVLPATTGASRDLPWFGLGHLTHAELLDWFRGERTRHSQTQPSTTE